MANAMFPYKKAAIVSYALTVYLSIIYANYFATIPFGARASSTLTTFGDRTAGTSIFAK